MSTAEFPDDDPDLDDEIDGDEVVDLDELPELEDDDIEIDDAAVDDEIPEADEDDDVEGVDAEEDEDEDEDDGDDESDDEEGDEAEESLDVLLAREKVLDEDDLGRIADESRDGLSVRPALVGAGEFTCRSCYLVKRRAQLADEKRQLCFDCA